LADIPRAKSKSWRAIPCVAGNALFAMENDLLTSEESAQRLGISTTSLYSWLAQSNAGTFSLHGQPVTIDYIQSGARGQGRIRIEAGEIARLRNLMRVKPRSVPSRLPPAKQIGFPGIVVKLGRPES
jgi:hypothetical protein